MKNKVDLILDYLDEIIKEPKCELYFSKDYQLVIAVMLSAQTTDKRVNKVTEVLFSKYPSLKALKEANVKDLEDVIRELGSFTKKAAAVKEIARILDEKYQGIVPASRKSLEAMPMVGRKTTNVILSELYHKPNIAVDTHVERVSKRLSLVKDNDSVLNIENKLKRKIPRKDWSKFHHQMVLFGRYYCLAKKPKCDDCKLQEICNYYKLKQKNI